MTSSTPPGLEGQVEAVNPLELFWEKNKRYVQLGVLAVALALGTNYVLQAMAEDARDETWSGFVAATGLDQAYAEGSSSPFAFLQIATDVETPELTSQMRDELKSLGSAKNERSAWALWVLAIDARERGAWDEATGFLSTLESGFPEHPLCKSTAHPVQFRDVVEKEDEDEEEDDETAPKKDEPVEYEEPVAGSLVARLRAQVEAQKAFRAEHSELYEAPAPTSAKVVVFKFQSDDDEALNGEIKVRLYDATAPKHAEHLLGLVEAGYWKGLAVHERNYLEGAASPFQQVTSGFSFGWPSTTSEQTDEWKAPTDDELEKALGEEEDKVELMKTLRDVEFEDSGVSHFPYMVAMAASTEGKSKATELSIISDAGHVQWDGRRVVVGQVIEGRELVDNIVELSGFFDVDSATQGTGIPLSLVKIEEVRVEDA